MTADRHKPWRVLERTTVLTAAPWLALQRENVQLPSGRVLHDFYRVEVPDFAVIVPITPAGQVVLVRGYKHGVGIVALAPPAGMIEADEEPLTAARRELREETGYIAETWDRWPPFVVDSNRFCGRMHLFRATGARHVEHPHEDETEVLDVELWPLADVVAGLSRGEFSTLAGAGGLALALLGFSLPAPGTHA